MTENELINTGISGFKPYQLQVMPTGFNQVATRADKQISDSQKRVQDLVALDPTNPLAALLTIMGKKREQGIRDDLQLLRGQEFKKDRETKYRKKILSDIKALDYGDALGIYAREKHGSDIDATLNDPRLMEGLEEIATRQKELSINDEVKLIGQMGKAMNEIIQYKEIGGDNSEFLDIQQGIFDKGMAILRGKGYTKKQILGAMSGQQGSTPPPAQSTTAPVGSGQPKAPSKNEIVRSHLLRPEVSPAPIVNVGKKQVNQTGAAKILEDAKKLVGKKADEANQAIRDGTFLHKTKDNVSNVINKVFGEEQLPKGWTKETMMLKPRALKQGEILQKHEQKRDVALNNSTGVYVGQRDGENGDFRWFVGDVTNGVQRSFDTQEEAFAFAQTYQPKVPKKIERMKLTGTDSAGSADFTPPPKSEEPKKDFPKIISTDARTEDEINTKPWQRTWAGGYLDKGVGKIKELYNNVMSNPNLEPEVEAIKDIKVLVEAGVEKVGFDGWPYVLEMMKKVGKWVVTPSNAEGATNEFSEMGSDSNNDNNINTGISNAGGVDNTIPSNKKHNKSYGGFAGYNPVATSVEQFMTDPFVEAMVLAESRGKERAVGYKLVEAKDSSGKTIIKNNGQAKLIYAKDKNGKKIPASFGIMQITIGTALSTKAGQELMQGLDPKNEDDRKEIVEILFDPYNNLKIGTEFANRLRTQLEGNRYASKFSPVDFDKAVSAAYNYKGENFAKDVLDKYKPKSMKDLLHRAYLPTETRRQIRVVGKQLGKVGR